MDLEGNALVAFEWRKMWDKPANDCSEAGRRLTGDKLARSVNQDVMLTGVVRDDTKPGRLCRDRGLSAAPGRAR